MAYAYGLMLFKNKKPILNAGQIVMTKKITNNCQHNSNNKSVRVFKFDFFYDSSKVIKLSSISFILLVTFCTLLHLDILYLWNISCSIKIK